LIHIVVYPRAVIELKLSRALFIYLFITKDVHTVQDRQNEQYKKEWRKSEVKVK